MKKLLLLALLTVSGSAFAQNVGIGTNKPDESAILDLKSSNKGFLLPRLTEKQKGLIPQPAEGLMIYQTDSNQGVYLYQGGNWKNIGNTNVTTTVTTANATTAYTANFLLVGDGTSTPVSSSVYVNPSNGNVGFGTSNPQSKFVVSNNGIQSLEMNYSSILGGNTFESINRQTNVGVDFIFYANNLASHRYFTSGSERFRVNYNGNVGVGTTNPQSKFVVSNDGKEGLELNYSSVLGGNTFESINRQTNAGVDFIFYANNLASHRYFTSGSERFRVNYNGNVGIGTTNPQSKFVVSNDGKEGLELNYSSRLGGNTFESINRKTNEGVDFIFYANNQASIRYFTGGNENLRIAPTGNIGIGILSPAEKLDVQGSIKQSAITSSIIKADGTGKLVAATAGTDYVSASSTTIGSIAKFSASGIVTNSSITESAITNGASVKLDSKSAGYLAIGDFGAQTPMSIPSGYRLVVQDGIITEKVKVALRSSQTDWADYVFASNYKLMPLIEVENYIKEYKHLPNVPSADEMVEQGVDVAKTSKMFMEKIEELTLYIIELKKEIEILKNQTK